MIASVVIATISLGAIKVMLTSYELSATARLSDNARSVLRTYGDQFLRLSTTDLQPSNGQTYVRWLFNPTNGFTSQGLVAGELNDISTFESMSDDPLTIKMRDEGGNAIEATVTRNVVYINSTTGAVATSKVSTASGYQLQGTFKASYTFAGKNFEEELTLLRAVP